MANIPITTDQYNGDNTPGYAYAPGSSVSDVVTISADVLVGSVLGDGVFCTGSSSNKTLINKGNILSGIGYGVLFAGYNGHIINDDYGQIIGHTGILLADFSVVENTGRIIGLTSTGIDITSSSHHVSVANYNVIYGRDIGIHARSALINGGTINNVEGMIHSAHIGIEIGTGAGLTTIISNGVDATIRGVDYSVHTSEGGIWVVNEGRLELGIYCQAVNEYDNVINFGSITGNVYLGSGNDRYNGLAGGYVSGPIQCGTGNDTFIAGPQREVVYGQAGADVFDFRASTFSPANSGRDIIQDFSHTEGDKIDLHYIDADLTHAGKQVFTFIGTDTFAHYRSLHPSVVGMLRFDPGLDRLQGNVNGNFATAEFEVLVRGVASLLASDLVLV